MGSTCASVLTNYPWVEKGYQAECERIRAVFGTPKTWEDWQRLEDAQAWAAWRAQWFKGEAPPLWRPEDYTVPSFPIPQD